MTIARVNAVGWAAFEKLTSTQANGLDINTTYALDKRSGQTDTLQSVVSTSGAGRVIPTHATGANAATNYTAGGGNTVIRIPASLSADRTYTFQNTNAVAGDAIHIYSDAGLTRTVTIADHSGDVLCRIGSSPFLDDDFDARGCVLRHNGTDWFLESLSYGRTEIPVRMAQLGVAMFRIGDSSIADYGGVCFDKKNGRYYLGGGTDAIAYSTRAGAFVVDDVIPAPQKATLRIIDIAASDTGIVVATTNNTSCYTQPDGGSFTRYAPFAAGTLKSVVTYDPVTSRFVAAASSASVAQLLWSVDGVVWNNYGAPPTVPANTTALAIGTNGLGRTVAAIFDTNGSVRFNYSDDGGTTWSAGSTVALTATGFGGAGDISHSIVYNDVRGEWAVCVGFTNTTEVLTSADGATWAVAFSSGSASDPEVCVLEAVNGLWVGVGRDAYDVLISRDGFTSMQFTGMRLDATTTGDMPSLCVGASHVMAFTEGALHYAPTFGRGLKNLT